jgi:hypothetical protein
MVDPARLTERHEFYFDLLPKLKRWGFNTLWWHFVDDEGFVLKLESHPELATPYAFTKGQTRAFIAAARDCGIDVVPEVESLGHGRYITRLPQYAHLADGPPQGFNAVCPSHRQTIPLLREIIEEVADLFESEYFHAGLDEVDLSGCKRCARRAQGKPHWWIYAQHVKAIHQIVAAAGKRMIMWADHVERSPAMLRTLPKDIVMAHWQYGEIRRDAIRRSLDAGFKVICAPSMLRWRHVVQPHRLNFANTESMIATTRKLAPRGVLGVANTWWTAWRILRDTGLPIAAYTGHLLGGGRKDRIAFLGEYLRREHGVRSKAAAQALWTLHDKTLLRDELMALGFDSPADMMDAIALCAHGKLSERYEQIDAGTKTLAGIARKVRTNRAAFNALVLSGRVAAGLIQGAIDLAAACEIYRKGEYLEDRRHQSGEVTDHLDRAVSILEGMCKRIDGLCEAVSKEWDRTRYPRDPKKAVRDIATPPQIDSLLGRMARHRAFLKTLTGELVKGVKRYRRGGVFPTGV